MKNVINFMLMMAAVFAFTACGKKDEGGSAAPAAPPVTTQPPVTTDFYGSEQEEFGNFENLKTYYLNKNFDEGMSDNLVVYHVGPKYGMQTNGGSFNIGFCIVFFGQTIGDCEGMGNNTAILENIVNNGEYKVTTSYNATGVSYNLAVGVEDDQFVFEPRNFDQSSESFNEMLNLDNQAVVKVVVTRATIQLTDNSQISGDLVEYFYGTIGNITGVERFVLSKDLPLLANPIAVFNAYGQPQGALNNVGNRMIRSVSAMAHNVQVNPFTLETTIVNAGMIGISLN